MNKTLSKVHISTLKCVKIQKTNVKLGLCDD
jgi:hypothetical protein